MDEARTARRSSAEDDNSLAAARKSEGRQIHDV
jgi:hypothetical protein